MQRVSTNLTLFFKFFLPILWTVFFGALTVAVFVYGRELAGEIQLNKLRFGTLFIFLSGVALFYFTLFRLKRVEVDEHFLYVTNYFKTVRYPFHQIASIEEAKFLFFRTVTITLKEKGVFGKKIRFLASSSLYESAWARHPHLKSSFFDKAQ